MSKYSTFRQGNSLLLSLVTRMLVVFI